MLTHTYALHTHTTHISDTRANLLYDHTPRTYCYWRGTTDNQHYVSYHLVVILFAYSLPLTLLTQRDVPSGPGLRHSGRNATSLAPVRHHTSHITTPCVLFSDHTSTCVIIQHHPLITHTTRHPPSHTVMSSLIIHLPSALTTHHHSSSPILIHQRAQGTAGRPHSHLEVRHCT